MGLFVVMIRRIRICSMIIFGIFRDERSDVLVKNNSIIAAQPDDEVIGGGVLIQRLVYQGNHPHVAILTGGGKLYSGRGVLEEASITEEHRSVNRSILDRLWLPESHLHPLNFLVEEISSTNCIRMAT